MESHAQEIVDAAMKLTPAERVKLVDAVLESLPVDQSTEHGAHDSEEVGRAWGEEIERRKADVRSGDVTPILKNEAVPGPRDDG